MKKAEFHALIKYGMKNAKKFVKDVCKIRGKNKLLIHLHIQGFFYGVKLFKMELFSIFLLSLELSFKLCTIIFPF